MRKYLLVFLLFLLPFQFTWAAAAGYCQHESSRAATHFGHHEHRHTDGGTASASKAGSVDDKASALDDDPDCAFCHLGCAQALKSVSIVLPFVPASDLVSAEPHPLGLTCVGTIDRPKWTVTA